MSESSASCIDEFEVFKVGRKSVQELQALPEDQLTKKYCVLLPLSSKDQIQPGSLLATLPADNHIVVDKTKFNDLIHKKFLEAFESKHLDMKAKADEKIFKAEEIFEKDVGLVSELIQNTIEAQREIFRRGILEASQLLSQNKITQVEFSSKVDELIANQKTTLDVLWTHPFFRKTNQPKSDTC